MKKVVLAFIFTCLAVSVASASSNCLGENVVAGLQPTMSLTDQPISSFGSGTAYSGYIDSCAYIGVVANPANGVLGNPFGSNDVTFIYQVIDSAPSAPSSDVSGITFGDFGSASLSGDQSSLSCSVNSGGSCNASSSFQPNNSGGFTFQFANPIPVGGFSDYLIVYTNQTNITTGLASLHDTSEAGLAADLATPTTVPEPGSLALVASGLIGLAGLLRRKLLEV